MPTFLNNCRGRDHARLYPQPFYDLGTTGPQSTQATGLRPGAECLVATAILSPDRDLVRFDWFVFAFETVQTDDTGEACRVFYGKLIRTETLSKTAASTDERFRPFFNIKGHFKQLSVIPSAH